MAFGNLGPPTTISPGQTHAWIYWRDGGHTNFGEQHAGPDIKTPGAELISFNQGKKFERNGEVNYFVSIKNIGDVPCLYNLQGGGSV